MTEKQVNALEQLLNMKGPPAFIVWCPYKGGYQRLSRVDRDTGRFLGIFWNVPLRGIPVPCDPYAILDHIDVSELIVTSAALPLLQLMTPL